MAEKTAGIPQSSNTGESVGRTVTGPLKRIIDNTVYSASRHASSTKRFLTNIKHSTTTPSTGELNKLDETLTEICKQIANLRALPDYVNSKKVHPLVIESINKDKHREEMDKYLAKSHYLTAISVSTKLIELIETELTQHGQPASPFDESVHDANSAVEQLGLLEIDPETGDLIKVEGPFIDDVIQQLINELEGTSLLAKSLEDAGENKDGDAKDLTPLARTENEQRHLPEEEAATHLEDSNLEDKLKDLKTEMEKVKLEIQEKAAEEKRLRDEILRVEAKIANRGVAIPTLIISIDEKKPTDPPLRNDDHSHPTILEKQNSSEHPHVSNDRAQTSQSDEKGSSRTTELVHQHTEKSEISERKKELEQEQERKQAQQTGSELDKIYKTLNNDEQISQGIRQYDDDIMPSEDDDDYAMRSPELDNRYSEYDKNGNPHLTPPSKTTPNHLKNVSFHNVHGYLVTFDGSSDFDIFRNISVTMSFRTQT
ncbi:hypothetical protein CRE_21002 [Caenorhabditis remanei]|uniref:Uncharacterized protein n=1 Tax=Caenorhabditis remanei TaxID=31234 RepID=E3NJV6_CAERE|nr:hypothetical protein CRE_21002 [Caenorhabditis remanei]